MDEQSRSVRPLDPTSSAVLVVSGDEVLVEEVERCAAGVGVRPRCTADVATALRRWGSAGLVVVGDDLAADLARASPPRRDHVHLVGTAPAGEQVLRAALALGVRSTLEVPSGSDWLTALMSAVADPRPPGQVVAVTGGSGGVGASTVAVALAQAVGHAGTALLVDADPSAAGAGLLLGLDATTLGRRAGLGWEDLARTGGRVAPTALRDGVPQRGGVGVLGWSEPPRALAADVVRGVLEAARQAYDLVVVDLPRGDGEVRDTVVARCSRVWVLVRPTLVGVAAAASRVATLGPDVGVVVRGAGLDDATVSRAVGASVVARLADHRGLEEAVDLGVGPWQPGRGAGRGAGRGTGRGGGGRGAVGRTVDALLGDLYGSGAAWTG